MYGLIWRVLPGPWFVKLVLLLGLIAAAAYGLWFHAFPWADPYLPFNDVTVDGGTGGGADPEGGAGVPGSDAEDADEDVVGVDVPVDDEAEEGEESAE